MKKFLLISFILFIPFTSFNLFAPLLNWDTYKEQKDAENRRKGIEVFLIASCIKWKESKNAHKPYDTISWAGAYGAYQYMPETWHTLIKNYFCLDYLPMTKENQDIVTYLRVNELLSLGYSDLEIGSIWFCGQPTWEGKEGYDQYGMWYSVPDYVYEFDSIYQVRKRIVDRLDLSPQHMTMDYFESLLLYYAPLGCKV
jgi:hypothetical protein